MRKLLIVIVYLLCLTDVFGQQPLSDKKRKAKEFYAFGRFEEARGILSNDRTLSGQDEEGRFLLALCYYQLNELDRAALLLGGLIKEEKTPYPECWLYMGKIFHARHQFEKAADYYKAYLKIMDRDVEKRRLVWQDIERCANGLAIRYKEQRVFAENLGTSVNTKYNEFAPIISPTRNDRLYFSSARQGSTGSLRNTRGKLDDIFGHYASDMYACQFNKGTWTAVSPMDHLLNSPQNDMLLDIKIDGSVLYYFNGDNEGGRIRMDTFRQGGDQLLTSDIFPGPIDPRQGDFYPHFVNDTLIVFASTRPGGFGGYDLYKTSLIDGRWQTPLNLGPDINTPYDETMPFQARDMRTLFFSTNNPSHSIGGLDIVKSVYIPGLNRWAPLQNMGLPINSAGDETHFRLSKDGFSGFLSSSRKDGFGQSDIYAVFFQDFLEEMEPPSPPVMAQTKPAAPKTSTSPAPITIPETPTTLLAGSNSSIEEPTNETTITETPPPAFKLPETTTSNPEKMIEESLPDVETVVTASPEKPVINSSRPIEIVTPESAPLPSPITPILVEDGSTLDTRDRVVLNALAKTMLEEQGHRLVITTYSNQQLNRAQQINEGINLSESVALYLFKQGVSSASIFLRAALADLEKAPNQGRIVAFNFTESDMTSRGGTVISLKNPWLDLTDNKLQQDLIYKVQIAAAMKNNFNNKMLEDYIDPMIEKHPDFPYYRYTIGAFSTYKPARQLRSDLARFGQKSAFPVPYVSGWRLEGPELEQKSTIYPDLKNYINR